MRDSAFLSILPLLIFLIALVVYLVRRKASPSRPSPKRHFVLGGIAIAIALFSVISAIAVSKRLDWGDIIWSSAFLILGIRSVIKGVEATTTAEAPALAVASELSGDGTCPNCRAILPVNSETCKCGATFGKGAAWRIEPLKANQRSDA